MPLHTGIIMLNAAAVPRVNRVRFSPRYWSGSGLPNAPDEAAVRRALLEGRATGVQVNRQDGGIYRDIEIEHYHTGAKFMPPHGWTYWHDVHFRDVEVGLHFTGGSNQRARLTDCSIAARRYGVLMQMDQRGWQPAWAKASKNGRQYGLDSLYVVTEAPFHAPHDGVGEAGEALQAALDAAGEAGGGTVYLPQGSYRVTRHLHVPAGVELRGVNDFMPRYSSVRTLLVADLPADRGKPDNPPFIRLHSTSERGGSGVSGLAIFYPHQDFRDIEPYPWTIRGMGPGCWVRRVFLGNCYNAIDFATHDNDRHVIARVCGSALNTAFLLGNSPTIGWVDNCQVRPQDWAWASSRGLQVKVPGDRWAKPTFRDIFRGTPHSLIPNLRGGAAITVGSGANVQISGVFVNGPTRAFDFIDHDGSGGGNARILLGGSEAGWGAWVKQLGGKGVTFVNFSINPMTRLPYVTPDMIPPGQLPKGMVMRVEPTVRPDAPIHLMMHTFYGRPEVQVGYDIRGGTVRMKQAQQMHGFGEAAIDVSGGRVQTRNAELGPSRPVAVAL